jgi:hypothetical protein
MDDPPTTRPEVEVAADAVWSLFAVGLLAQRPDVIVQAAAASGVPIRELRLASRRRDAHTHRRPALHVAPVSNTEIANRESEMSNSHRIAMPQKAPKQPNTAPATAAKRAAKEPLPGMRRCSGDCGQLKPVDEFHVKDPVKGTRRSECIACERAYKRRRYLTVRKIRQVNMAGLTFVVSACDEVCGLRCIDCDGPLEPGQMVTGKASLRHCACPS